jgi:hypothetical protein
VLAAKCFFVAAATTDTICMIQKMSLFCVGYYKPIQKFATWCQLLMSADMKNRFSETKKLMNPDLGPSGLELGPARHYLLFEVEADQATTPPKRCCLLGQDRGLPSRTASLAAMVWREDKESHLC